ncbi:hypothetical protein ACO2Q1_13540 [Brevundimonas sp. VNH65]|uniref:hypothetical protein n=1 Tax=Brevundimonas sp. VNH65 TaxID=3400917 RepID=UPI003C0A8B87
MTDAPTPIADDIVDPADLESDRLERRADALLGEDRAFAARRAPSAARGSVRPSPDRGPVRSVRAAMREDVAEGRLWIVRRADHAREAVQDAPMRASLYALGVGVLIGLLLRR